MQCRLSVNLTVSYCILFLLTAYYFSLQILLMSRHIAVGIVSRLWSGLTRNRSSIPDSGTKYSRASITLPSVIRTSITRTTPGKKFDSRWCHQNFSLTFFWSHYGPGVDSACNRNEYGEYFLGVKAAGAWGWQPYHLHLPTVLKSGGLTLLEPQGLSTPTGMALPFFPRVKN